MPPKRTPDIPKEPAECILRYGKSNNVIQWAEEMQTAVTALYGLTGMFFTTNRSYRPPRVTEESILRSFYESDEENDDEVEYDGEEEEPTEEELAAAVAAKAAARARVKAAKEARIKKDEKILSKVREGAHESRRKAVLSIEDNEKKIYPMMWMRMSPASQSRVREEEGFEEVRLTLDCVSLWGFIRATHLTHIFGAGDPMKEVNCLEQEIRFSSMRQGEREFISTFKTRFDNQVRANEGSGVPRLTDRKLALEFIMKLDPKRYKRMLSQMRNDSLRNDPDAYPSTLASAFRIASGWTNDDPSSGSYGLENNSAYLADTCFVTKAKDPEKGSGVKTPGGDSGSKSKKKSEVLCFVCGLVGHYARDCSQRKGADKALVVEKSSAEDEDRSLPDEWDLALISMREKVMFTRYELLLDNQSSVDIIGNADLIYNQRKAEKSINMCGIQRGAKPVIVDTVGDFGEFGQVYFSEHASANILSFASQVNAGADIEYDKTLDRFTLIPAGSSNMYHFCRKDVEGSEGRFYICDLKPMMKIREEHAYIQTVSENLGKFTKREVESARAARDMLARLGFPSVSDAIDMVNSGSNFSVCARDFQIAEAIWGKDIPSLKGKTKKKATAIAEITVAPTLVQQQQVLAIDIMYIDKLAFLIGVATPLDLTIVTSLTSFDTNKSSRSAEAVRKGLLYFYGVLASQNFRASLIMSDGEGAVGKLVTELNSLGVEVDISGAGGHVPRVERRIQVVKERVRAYSHYLPFTMPMIVLSMCVMYVVSRLNYIPRSKGMSSRELFLGRKPDAKRDFRCGFGDYVVSTVPNTDSSMSSRTEDGVVMLPTGNRTGSVRVYSLHTGKIVTRDQLRVLPMPMSTVAHMNELAMRDGRTLLRKHGVSTPPLLYDTPQSSRIAHHPLPNFITPAAQPDMEPSISIRDPAPVPICDTDLADESGLIPVPGNNRKPLLGGGVDPSAAADAQTGGPQDRFPPTPPTDSQPSDTPTMEAESGGDTQTEDAESGGELCDSGGGDIGNHQEAGGDDSGGSGGGASDLSSTRQNMIDYFRNGGSEVVQLVTRVRARHAAILRDREQSGMHVMNITVREAMRTRGAEAERVILKELEQMLNKKVWTPVDFRQLTAEQRKAVIRSSMFLKEKFLATGEFEKLKARLVAGGDQQDKNLYDDLSAPTVSTSAVFTILSIAAHEGRHAAVVDIGGAFLNAEMKTGVDVHMRLDRTMSELMTRLDPEYKKYLDNKGCVTVLLDRALYGCVESAALWYENLRETMQSLGYERNPYEICVFNKRDANGIQCTATVHVDDLFIASKSPEMIDHLTLGLKSRYGEISKTQGTVLNYLGMTFDLSHPGEARVSMKGYVDDLLESCAATGGARTPATDGLFEAKDGAEMATEAERVQFHSDVAKILYLAKKARPDVLLAVAYLATRVSRCTKDDLVKLVRLVRYLRDTRERGLLFRPGSKGITVSTYIDAAYGVHHDHKSHTGSCVVIGEVGAVHCRSSKQQIVCKSSTEAELVALSDCANQALYLRNFLIQQGYQCGPVTVYQDNLSCMALVERGRSGAERTRHIDIRYYWLKERVSKGEAIVKHMGTVDMFANMLTKPLQGQQFINEREGITGWDRTLGV